MMVERWIKGDALDLTWAYFWQVHTDAGWANRLASARPLTVEEANDRNIDEQKQRKDREL